MKVLVTGAAGFLGRRLVSALLSTDGSLAELTGIVAADIVPGGIEDPRVDIRTGSIAQPDFVQSIVERDVGVVFHLGAVLSGQAEREFDLGVQVNVDATRNLLSACRSLPKAPRFVFASTIAVFGGELPDVVPEERVLQPQSSYGTGKAIAELLVAEYSRRGFVDGINCRLPTVTVRPGAPNSALSSFVSSIIREPLGGIDAVCPVPPDTRVWIGSPGVVTRNLIHAARVPASALEGRLAVNLPGLCVTPAQMLDSLERAGGAAARARVRCELDPRVTSVVTTWPGALDDHRARRLGFTADADFDEVVKQYVRDSR